jgi:hypothetical protein
MSTLVVATLKSNSSSPPAFQNTSGTETGRLCRAFVNFDGTGTIAIRTQFNVSSITDNGFGDYTLNFTNALADANYAMLGTVGATPNQATTVWPYDNLTARTTTAIRTLTLNTGGSVAESTQVAVAIFR